MEKTEILVIGTHAEILQTILRLINNNDEWNGTGALSAPQAIDEFNRRDYKLVLLGAGLSDADEASLCDELCIIKPGIVIVKHFGGGSGLLFAEIIGALAKI